jgi:hypothetical protein
MRVYVFLIISEFCPVSQVQIVIRADLGIDYFVGTVHQARA